MSKDVPPAGFEPAPPPPEGGALSPELRGHLGARVSAASVALGHESGRARGADPPSAPGEP